MVLQCIYVSKTVNISRSIFFFAKMRLTSVKVSNLCNETSKQTGNSVTLPRLELLAVVIGKRATNIVTQQLRFPIDKRVVFTDLQCVLHWMKTSKLLSTFVENRIKELRKQENVTFQYIPSDQNPADHITRGLTVPDLKNCNL